MQEQTQWVEELFRQYKTEVYRLALSLVKDTGQAEDVLQETFLKVQLARRPAPGKEKPWLMRIARNCAYDLLRKRGREFTEENAVICQSLDRQQTAGLESNLEYLALISGVSPLEQEIITLHIVVGLSHKEAAQVLRMTVHSEKKRYERALKTLRRQYEEGLQ